MSVLNEKNEIYIENFISRNFVHIFQQSRTDRDEYVLIRWENVDNGLQGYLSRNWSTFLWAPKIISFVCQ